jgi:hypothetical protein
VLQSNKREPLGLSMPIARRPDPARGRGSSLRPFSANERAPRWHMMNELTSTICGKNA